MRAETAAMRRFVVLLQVDEPIAEDRTRVHWTLPVFVCPVVFRLMLDEVAFSPKRRSCWEVVPVGAEVCVV